MGRHSLGVSAVQFLTTSQSRKVTWRSGRRVPNSGQTVSSHCCLSVASAFSPDLQCSYHGFFEVLKTMGVTGCVCCAGSTPAPTFLPTRTGHRVSLIVLAGLEATSVVPLPGQRVIARMLTGWGAAPCLSTVVNTKITLHDFILGD